MDEEKLQKEIAELREAINELNNQKFFWMYSTWTKLVISSLIRGLFVGLGSVVGATLLLYFLIQFLSRIDFIPIIGEWATRIVEIINGA